MCVPPVAVGIPAPLFGFSRPMPPLTAPLDGDLLGPRSVT